MTSAREIHEPARGHRFFTHSEKRHRTKVRYTSMRGGKNAKTDSQLTPSFSIHIDERGKTIPMSSGSSNYFDSGSCTRDESKYSSSSRGVCRSAWIRCTDYIYGTTIARSLRISDRLVTVALVLSTVVVVDAYFLLSDISTRQTMRVYIFPCT